MTLDVGDGGGLVEGAGYIRKTSKYSSNKNNKL